MPSSDPYVGIAWPKHGANCICHGCQGRRRRLAREAEPVQLVDTTHTSSLLRGLRRTYTLAQIAEATGLSVKSVWKASQPNESILRETADMILAMDVTRIPRRVR